MMKIEFSDWSVNVHQPLLAGTEVSFKVRFKSLSNQRYEVLSVRDVFKTTGTLSPDIHVLDSHVLAKNVSFAVNEERIFDVTMKAGRAISYRGKNGSAPPVFIATAVPEGLSKNAIVRFFTGDSVAQSEQPLRILESGTFKVFEAPVIPVAKRQNGWMVGLFFLVFGAVALSYFTGLSMYVPIALFLAYLGAVTFRRITADNLGTMTFHPESVNPKFS